MPNAKIQLRGQFTIDARRAEPLSEQLVRLLQETIEAGCVAQGTRLPSTRSLARALGVSRNTVLAAYDELIARGLVRSRPGAGMFAVTPPAVRGFNLQSLMRDAQYPSRAIALADQDGNPLALCW